MKKRSNEDSVAKKMKKEWKIVATGFVKE